MKKYAVLLLSSLLCFNTSFGMDDKWVEECTKTHREFRSFVKAFDYDSDPIKTTDDIKQLEKAHNKLSDDLIEIMVPVDSTLSLSAKDKFFDKYKQLLCVPWLNESETPKILKPARSNAMKEWNDRKNLTSLVTKTRLSFVTMLLLDVSIHPLYNRSQHDEAGVCFPALPSFGSYAERYRYEKSLIPMQDFLLQRGACVTGQGYYHAPSGINEGPWHVFSRVNDLSPEFITLVLEREGIGLVNERCCERNDYDFKRKRYVSRSITPLAKVLERAFKTRNFYCENDIAAMCVLVEHGARLDVEGTQGAFSDFIEFLTNTCPWSQKEAFDISRFVNHLLAKTIILPEDLTNAHRMLAKYSKSEYCKSPRLWENMDRAIEFHRKSNVQRLVGTQNTSLGKKNTKGQECLPS